MSRQSRMPNFKSISQRMTEKKVKKTEWTDMFAKGNNSSESRSTETKVELDLYRAMTKSYTKFQVNIPKDD